MVEDVDPKVRHAIPSSYETRFDKKKKKKQKKKQKKSWFVG